LTVGIIVSVLDAIDDGFSVWNGVSIACFVVVLLYGIRDLTNRTEAPAPPALDRPFLGQGDR
jgi:hypothetical protein